LYNKFAKVKNLNIYPSKKMKNRIGYFCFAKSSKYGLSEKFPCCLLIDSKKNIQAWLKRNPEKIRLRMHIKKEPEIFSDSFLYL